MTTLEISSTTTSNVLSGDDFRQDVIAATDLLYNHLAPLSGPYSEFAVVPHRDVNTVHHVYTKDGIDVLKQIKFANRTSEYIRHLATYIGSRVDAACHDGTTTSMMLFLSLAKNMYRIVNKLEESPDKDAIRRRIVATLERDLMRLRDLVDENTITIGKDAFKGISRNRVIYYIAYHQALMSSKGNRDLSDAVAQVVSRLPPELYGHYTLNRTAQETAQEFEVVKQDHDLSATAAFPMATLYNSYMKTQYNADHVDVLPIDPETLSNQNTPEADKLTALFKEAMGGNPSGEDLLDRDLVLITTEFSQPILERINLFNRAYKNKIIPVELMQTNTQMFVHIIEAMRCIAGQPSLGDQSVRSIHDALISNARVKFANNTVFLSNLYIKTDNVYHPFYEDPDAHPPYTRLVTEMRDTIQQFEDSAKPDERLKRAIPVIIPLYRQLVCQNIWDLKIGGPLHDHLANYATVQDAFGAATSGIEKGSIIGGLHRLLVAYEGDQSIFSSNFPRSNTDSVVMACISLSLKSVLKDTYRTDFIDIDDEDDYPEMNEYHKHLREHDMSYIHLDVDKQTLCVKDFPEDIFTDMSHEEYQSLMIEPAEKYKELINRLIEVLPKMIGTTSFIDIENVSGALTHG